MPKLAPHSWYLPAWLACAALLPFAATGCGPDERTQLERSLIGRGRVAVLQPISWSTLPSAGSQLVAWDSLQPLAAAIAGADPNALASAMTQHDIQGLLVDPHAQSHAPGLAGRLAHFARVEGLQGVLFNRSAALYVLDPVRVWSPNLRAGLSGVARRLIAGTPPPQVSSFPEPVRRLEPVEVMVLLRRGTQAVLWRSARGSSFARALLTATAVARQRWIERSAALGGKLDEQLPHLTVELSLLQDDGEIGARSQQFVDQVVTSEHGVGFERKGGWHYLLPDAAHQSGRSPSAAYRQLFSDDGLPVDSLDNHELRLYRLAVQKIGVSEPAREPDDGLSDVAAPSDVLGH